MKIITPSFEILCCPSREAALSLIELAGQVCYKSEDKITKDSASSFVEHIANVRKHESVIEHSMLTVKFVCDRGVSHELVRHRLCAFSQESTRYCNYSRGKFDNEITVIKPIFWSECSFAYGIWEQTCLDAEESYFHLLNQGASPQEARSVLPNSLKTEIVVSANFREWRHIFRLRCAETAHPQMRQLMIPLQGEMHTRIPELF